MNILKIECVGNFPGGTYDRVEIDGVATVNGDLNAEVIDVDGVFTVNGSIQCRELCCDGVGTLHGNVSAEEMDIDGTLTVGGSVHANTFTCDGAATFRGDMRCVSFESDGSLTLTGSKLESTTIDVDGFLSAKNAQISADKISVDGRIQADEIVGETVEIHSASAILSLLHRESTANVIEATSVRLSGVVAGIVGGKDIYLGKNCRVARVDCSGTLFVHPSSQVTEITGEYTSI